MIALPTAYTARNNAISNAQIPVELQNQISSAISTAIENGLFSVDIFLVTSSTYFESQLTSWLKSLGYFVDYTDQPDQTGNLEVRWG